MRYSILLIALCGCASTGASTSDDSTPRQATILTGGDSPTLLADQPHATAADIAASPTEVWSAAEKVYAAMEIPVTVENPRAHQLGNANFYKTHQLAGESMTRFVDCGSGMDGAKAASYRIYMSLLTTIDADGKGGSTVKTTFVPMGQDLSGGSTDRIPCGTTGRFEQLVLDQIKGTVARK
ncbi:MAG: hypothetical protein ACHQWU_11725 [Gemmatimonadales bacterium]|jgi:hypothetical protein